MFLFVFSKNNNIKLEEKSFLFILRSGLNLIGYYNTPPFSLVEK
jgi:hypothetical protein